MAANPQITRFHHHPATTQRQLEILILAMEGKNTREIAKQLVLSTATVRNHLHTAYTLNPGMRENVRRARKNAVRYHRNKIADLRERLGL